MLLFNVILLHIFAFKKNYFWKVGGVMKYKFSLLIYFLTCEAANNAQALLGKAKAEN